jgi:peptide/nickel transport system substrate-binding protein
MNKWSHPGNKAGNAPRALALMAGAMIVLAACAPPPPVARTDTGPDAKPSGAPTTLRIATVREPVDGIALFGGSGDANAQHTSMFHVGLTAFDGQGTLLPRAAQKVPSISDGDWKMLPDGGMELTWKLRPGTRWHDGTPLTAEDFVFGLQVVRDPEVPLPRTGGVSLVREVTAPDPETLVLRWSQTFYAANQGSAVEFPAVPRHIIGDLYRAGDKQAFVNSPYWAREFVGIGPYRMGEWSPGAYTEAHAFDGYFLGRPKIDRVVLRYFLNPNAMVAGMLAGDIDLVTVGSLKMDDIQPVIDAWGTQRGTVIPSLTDATYAQFQFRNADYPWARDVRVRQAISHLVDRQTLADTFSPGGGPTDIFAAKQDPVYRLAEQRGFARFPYDVARAERLLGEAGWTRAADGVMANAAGQRLAIEVRVVSRVEEGLAVADQWKRGGLDAEMFTIGKGASNQQEMKATNKGVFWNAHTLTPDTLEMWKSNQIATEQNRWSGRNLSAYASPEFDRLFDGFVNELDTSKSQSLLADLLRWQAEELFWVPGYYEVASAITAFRAGIRGPGAILPVSKVATWNIHEWVVD